jgi:hypothetical protein
MLYSVYHRRRSLGGCGWEQLGRDRWRDYLQTGRLRKRKLVGVFTRRAQTENWFVINSRISMMNRAMKGFDDLLIRVKRATDIKSPMRSVRLKK